MNKDVSSKRLEEQRISALHSWDAVKYFELCNELGCNVEREDLYELGRAEMVFEQKNLEGLLKKQKGRTGKRVVSDDTYRAFYQAGKYLSLEPLTSVEVKRELLAKFFYHRFGKDGKQPLRYVDGEDIGKIFKGVIMYAKKRTEAK